MGKTKYLSEAEKQLGRKHMYRQEVFNGIAYSLLGDTLVYLLAIYFGAGNLALGYIASATYIAGVVLPFVSIVFQGKNNIKVQSSVWLIRGMVCFGYVGLFFLTGQKAVLLLLSIYTLFNIFRMIGIALNDFTMKSISSVSNRGKVVGNVNVAYQSSSMVVRCFTALVLALQQFSGLVGLLSLQMIGSVMNFFAAYEMSLIPSRTTITHKKGRTVLTIFKEAMVQSPLRRRLILRWLSIGVAVIFGLTVPFLRVELGLSNSMVVLYSVVLGLSIVAASYISKQFSDRLGSRPLVFISALFSLFFFLVWALITPNVPAVWFFVLGFFTNFFVGLINLLVVRLVQQVMPDDDAVTFNSMVNFVIAIIAFFVGLLSGFLADSAHLAQSLFTFQRVAVGNSYTLVFLFAMILAGVEVVVASRIQEVGAYSSQEAAAVVFSMHGLKAVSMIEKLERTTDPAKRRSLMHSLGSNYNNMATSEIRSILASPFSADKMEAVRALGDRPRKALLDDLIAVAQDDDSFVQLDAIAALGSYKDPKVKAVMLNLLKYGRWSSVRSMASKTLARITDTTEYLPLINELSHSAKHIDEVIDYLIAKRHMDPEGTFFQEIFFPHDLNRSATFRQTRYSVIGSFFKFGSPRLATLYTQLNSGNFKTFFPVFLTEARDLNQIDQHYEEILTMFAEQRWPLLRDFCLEILEGANLSFDPNYENLKKGIIQWRDMDIEQFDIQDVFAAFYFSYSLGKHSHS